MKIRFRYLNLVIVALLLKGCAGTYSTVSFEVLEPASLTFPEEVDSILILNRAPISRDMFDEKDLRQISAGQFMLLDSMVVSGILSGMKDILEKSPAEGFREPVWASLRRDDTTGLNLPLTKRDIHYICDTYGVDAVISLDYYRLDADDQEHYDLGVLLDKYYVFANQVKWTVYLDGHPAPFNEYTTNDTLYFSVMQEGVFQPVPSPSEMIREITYESGYRYGQYLVPVWLQTTRYLYRGKGEELRVAGKFTDDGNWDSAYHIWQRLTENGDSLQVSRAYYNMAIYFELEDNLDSALKLTRLALERDTAELIENYREEIETRILNRREVIRQLE